MNGFILCMCVKESENFQEQKETKMDRIRMVIWTETDLASKEIAEAFFRKTEELGIQPEKISEYEPINREYTLKDAVELWSKEEDGVWDLELERLAGKAGGLLARSRSRSITYDISWYKRDGYRLKSSISFWISPTKYKKNSGQMMELFRYTVDLVEASHGYITHSMASDRQYAPPDSDFKMRGVFWCNYYGEKYRKLIGEERIRSFDWYRIEENGEKGVYTFLDEVPDGDILRNLSLEESAKIHLGGNELFVKREEGKWYL